MLLRRSAAGRPFAGDGLLRPPRRPGAAGNLRHASRLDHQREGTAGSVTSAQRSGGSA